MVSVSLSLMINMLPSSENNDVIPEYFLIKVPYSYKGNFRPDWLIRLQRWFIQSGANIFQTTPQKISYKFVKDYQSCVLSKGWFSILFGQQSNPSHP